MLNRTIIIIIIISFVLFSCKKADKPDVQVLEEIDVIVLNEGNFQSGNATVTAYSSSIDKVYPKVFQNNNLGRPLGDVAQSMIQKDGKAFIVVNNSNKIEVVDINSFTSIGSINGLNSPRYILPVGANKAYVSDLYQGIIYVVDLERLIITDSIISGSWTEQMVLSNNKAFVCHTGNDEVLVIDVIADTVLAKIPTNISPLSITKDFQGNVWVSCSGGFNEGNPALIKIDPVLLHKSQVIEIKDISKSIGNIHFNQDRTLLYYLSTDIFRLPINQTELPNSPFIKAFNRNFYDFGISPQNGDLYISDAIDYQQAGVIYKYNSIGQQKGFFKAGLIPGYIHFIQ
jgi:YVTN family beta-propeller protein